MCGIAELVEEVEEGQGRCAGDSMPASRTALEGTPWPAQHKFSSAATVLHAVRHAGRADAAFISLTEN